MISVNVSENPYHIRMNGYDIELFHKMKDSSRSYLWNLTYIEKEGETVLPRGTDIVGVLREEGEADFMGGVHGDEKNVAFFLEGDGKPIQKSGEFSRVSVLMDSYLTRVSTGEPILFRHVEIVFFEKSITIDNTFTSLTDEFRLQSAFNGGMFAFYEKDLVRAGTNLGGIDTNGELIERELYSSHELTEAFGETKNARVTVRNLIGHTLPSYRGMAYYYGNEQIPRVKFYFGTDEHSVWKKGHVLRGRTEYILE